MPMFCGHGSILGENAYIKQTHGLQLLPSCIFPIVHMQKKTKCNISMSYICMYMNMVMDSSTVGKFLYPLVSITELHAA